MQMAAAMSTLRAEQRCRHAARLALRHRRRVLPDASRGHCAEVHSAAATARRRAPHPKATRDACERGDGGRGRPFDSRGYTRRCG